MKTANNKMFMLGKCFFFFIAYRKKENFAAGKNISPPRTCMRWKSFRMSPREAKSYLSTFKNLLAEIHKTDFGEYIRIENPVSDKTSISGEQVSWMARRREMKADDAHMSENIDDILTFLSAEARLYRK